MRIGVSSLAVLSLAWPAQGAAAPAEPIEEIVVVAKTGSRIARQADFASPLAEYDAAALDRFAAKDIRDLVGLLPTDSGAENNSDNLTQNFTVGTANVNLRGLGVASTLVLLNGKRQVASAVQTDDGSGFVDLAALVPLLAVARVEILKDGASAIYGSDAVAGVVNFITRRDFEGLDVRGEYRTRVGDGTQADVNLDAVFGATLGDEGRFLVAASYLDRSSLVLGEVDWLEPATSGFGNPGSFTLPSTGRTVADPGCTANGGLRQTLTAGDTICRFDFGPQITAVPMEDRLQGYARLDWHWTESTRLWAEIGFARNDISREVSPSFPVLNTPLVPARNPGNVFGEDVFFQGRPYGVGQPTEINYYQHHTVRTAFGAEGLWAEHIGWELSYVYGANDAVLNPRDIVAANFQAALSGLGGTDCDTGPTAAVRAVPGVGPCRYFNPFSSAFSARPGDATYNDPALRRFIVGDYVGDAESSLGVLDANVTGYFGNLGGGPVGFALGVQRRDQSLGYVYDTITRHDGFAFLIGNPNFSGETDVIATYGEVLLPFAHWFEATGALRYADYGEGVGSTLDPKFTVLAVASSTWSLRASVGTSFRAPSPFQTQGVQTNFVNITDHDGSTTFAGRRTLGNPGLKPETSRAVNVGATWQPRHNIEWSADFFDYAFEDVLRKDNAQAIVNANPFDRRVERTSAGTVSIVNVAFINADAIDVRGVDVAGRAHFDLGLGTVEAFFDGTVLLAYDVTNSGVVQDGLGRLNRANVGAPTQAFKAVTGLGISRGRTDANLLVRHIGGYRDDGGQTIDAFTTFDANLGVDLGAFAGGASRARLAFGVVNLAGTAPPRVNVAGSYDPRSADPRGRRVFIRFETGFRRI